MTEHLFKILVVGDVGAGKSCIINQYIRGEFSANYKSTIGVDFGLKMLNYEDKTVRLQFWDIAGQERFGNMTRVYYKDAVGAFVVFDQTREKTYKGVSRWKDDIDNKVWLRDEIPIPCVLLANKEDLSDKKFPLTDNALETFSDEHNFVKVFKTSAKTGKNIKEAARELVKAIMKRHKTDEDEDEDDGEDDANNIVLGRRQDAQQDVEKKSSKCCGN